MFSLLRPFIELVTWHSRRPMSMWQKWNCSKPLANGFLCELKWYFHLFAECVCVLSLIWCAQYPWATGRIASVTWCFCIVHTLIIVTAFIWPHKNVCYKTSISMLCMFVLNNVAFSLHNVLISLLLYHLKMPLRVFITQILPHSLSLSFSVFSFGFYHLSTYAKVAFHSHTHTTNRTTNQTCSFTLHSAKSVWIKWENLPY